MKRSQQAVPKADTGAIRGDGHGSQGMRLPQGTARNTDVGRRGAGQVAPRPQASKQGLIASSSVSAPVQASMARVAPVGSSPTGKSGRAGSFMPVQNNAMANLASKKIGQQVPNTAAAATRKPNRKGGSAFYGES